MGFPRAYHNLTMLPDGTVLASGGGRNTDSTNDAGAVLEAEIWSPVTEAWTTMARGARSRLYHSIALLLPDGRVLVSGGGRFIGTNQLNAEIFSPPYLFKGPRPVVSSAPAVVGYGTSFPVSTADAASIAKVSLIRLGANTHAFDHNQRFVELPFQTGGGGLTVQAPASPNVAPPGFYMLFIVAGSGVPSVAAIVQLTSTAAPDTTPPHILSRSPAPSQSAVASDATVQIGFDEPLSSNSVTATSVRLRAAGSTTDVPAAVSAAGSSIALDPSILLSGSTTYQVTVAGTIADLAGNVLGADDTWSFTTAAPPTSPPGLVAAYGFNEASGASLRDVTGSGHDGSIAGAVWDANGRFGGALRFDGVNDMVSIPDAADLDFSTGMTLEAWINPTTSTNWRTVVLKESIGELSYALYSADNTGRPGSWIRIAGASYSAIGASTLATGTWTHVAATYDGAAVRLFVNGTQTATRTVSGTITASANPLRLGGNTVWNEFFGGLIDEVRLYNRALSAAEIQADMLLPVDAPPDTTAPVVTAVAPPDGSTGVSLSTPVSATFNEALNAATLDAATFLVRNASAVSLNGTVSFDAATRTASFVPSSPLTALSAYTVTLKGGAADPRIKDLAGNALASDVSWSFTTAAPPPPPPPDTIITAAPPAVSRQQDASFVFSSTQPDSVFECRLDGAPFVGCVSPATLAAVPDGSHTFQVRAVSPVAGADLSPAAHAWVVDTTAPVITQLAQSLGAGSATITWTTNEPSDSTVTYGESPDALTSVTASQTMTTAHSIAVSGLVSNRLYYYRVLSTDAAGNSGVLPPAALPPASFTISFERLTSPPAAVVLETGTQPSGSAAALRADDDTFYQVSSTTSGTRTSQWYASFPGVVRDLTNLRVSYQGKFSIAGINQRIYIWRWTTSAWVQLDSRTVGTAEVLVSNLAPGGTLSEFVGGTGATGELRIRVRGTHNTAAFVASGDMLQIAYDRAALTPSLSIADVSILEGTGVSVSATAVVMLSAAAAHTVSVAYLTTDSSARAGLDYTAAAGTLTFAPGEVSQTITIGIVSDNVEEPDEMLLVTLGSPVNATIADGEATVTIRNDDTVVGTVPAGLVAGYALEEGSGTTVADLSATGNPATISGAAWNPTGRFGRALTFDGVNDRLNIADANSLDLTTGLTLEAWVLPATATGWRTVVLKETAGGLCYALYASGDTPRPSLYVNFGGASVFVQGPAALPVGVWTHLAATFDGTTLRLYVNGILIASRVSGGSIRVSAGALRVGGNAVWGEYFAGTIDDVRVYNRPLAPAEIQADMARPVP